MQGKSHRALQWIAAFKLLKAALLLIVAAAALRLLKPGMLELFVQYLHHFPLAQGYRPVSHLVDQVADLSPHNLKFVAGLAVAYAVLYLVEGIGLWMRKRWAEYFTTIVTASLIPFEVYELFRGVSIGKVAAVAINVAIVVYLICVLRADRGKAG